MSMMCVDVQDLYEVEKGENAIGKKVGAYHIRF
jgi:hypothetical protein